MARDPPRRQAGGDAQAVRRGARPDHGRARKRAIEEKREAAVSAIRRDPKASVNRDAVDALTPKVDPDAIRRAQDAVSGAVRRRRRPSKLARSMLARMRVPSHAAVPAASASVRARALFRNFLRRELFTRYLGSVTGLAWAFVHPLVLLVVYHFVFTTVFRRTASATRAFSLSSRSHCGHGSPRRKASSAARRASAVTPASSARSRFRTSSSSMRRSRRR